MIDLILQVLEADYDPLTYVEKCLRGEIKADRAHWNTSGKYALLMHYSLYHCDSHYLTNSNFLVFLI